MRLIDRIRAQAQCFVGITEHRVGKIETAIKGVKERLPLLERPWEDLISLKSFEDLDFEVLASAGELRGASNGEIRDFLAGGIEGPLLRDHYPIPVTADREGYYGDLHFDYWLSGLRDVVHLRETAERLGVEVGDYLDFGCASGRVLRHAALQWDSLRRVVGIDLNRRHIDWIGKFLPSRIEAIQGHSIPCLPLADASIDLVSAFSVFTHIEAFETTWLAELRRVLRPGGIAWVTIHSEHTWRELDETWPLFGALRNHHEFLKLGAPRVDLPCERTTFRWRNNQSYSANVFYEMKYIERVWGRLFEIVEVKRRFPKFQDVLVLRKRR